MKEYVTRARRGEWTPGEPHPGMDEYVDGKRTGVIVGGPPGTQAAADPFMTAPIDARFYIKLGDVEKVTPEEQVMEAIVTAAELPGAAPYIPVDLLGAHDTVFTLGAVPARGDPLRKGWQLEAIRRILDDPEALLVEFAQSAPARETPEPRPKYVLRFDLLVNGAVYQSFEEEVEGVDAVEPRLAQVRAHFGIREGSEFQIGPPKVVQVRYMETEDWGAV